MNIFNLIFYFFFYSFIGWFTESCYCSLRPKKWVNRGFLRGPICPIYGTGALVLMLLIMPLREITHNIYLNEVIVFFVGLVVCDIVEYLTSFIMEKLFHARWWDYSNKKFNLHGRICLTHTLYWGTGACVFSYIVQPIISSYFTDLINPNSIKTLAYIFLTVFAADLIDTVISTLGIRSLSDAIIKLTDEISAFTKSDENKFDAESKINAFKERYEKINNFCKKRVVKTRERFFKAYPVLQNQASEKLRFLEEQLDELKNKFNK